MNKLGPHQRKVLKLLEKKDELTLKELTALIYEIPRATVRTNDFRYIAMSRTVTSLVKRGLLDRKPAEARFRRKYK